MVLGCDAFEVHGLSIAKRAIKIVLETAVIVLAIFRCFYMAHAGQVRPVTLVSARPRHPLSVAGKSLASPTRHAVSSIEVFATEEALAFEDQEPGRERHDAQG